MSHRDICKLKCDIEKGILEKCTQCEKKREGAYISMNMRKL